MSMVYQTKKNQNMDMWVHMPPTSFKYQYFKALRVMFEAKCYTFILEQSPILTPPRPVLIFSLYQL